MGRGDDLRRTPVPVGDGVGMGRHGDGRAQRTGPPCDRDARNLRGVHEVSPQGRHAFVTTISRYPLGMTSESGPARFQFVQQCADCALKGLRARRVQRAEGLVHGTVQLAEDLHPVGGRAAAEMEGAAPAADLAGPAAEATAADRRQGREPDGGNRGIATQTPSRSSSACSRRDSGERPAVLGRSLLAAPARLCQRLLVQRLDVLVQVQNRGRVVDEPLVQARGLLARDDVLLAPDHVGGGVRCE